ncbi:hypothetical protein ACFE04_014519 [Oxalis oulophora]
MSTYYSSSSHNIKQKKKRGEDDLQNGAFGGCKRRKKEMSRNKDMFEELGEDLMFMVLSQLDARSAALCLLVSRHWHSVASTDRLWGPKYKAGGGFGRGMAGGEGGFGGGDVGLGWGRRSKCEELWHGKAHIPRMSQTRGLSKLTAYSLSIMDSKRTRITKDDLCDHAWEFHFTTAVPEYWQNLDPYWTGTFPLLRRYFHPDGSQTADPGDKVWGGHESCYSIVTTFVGEGKIKQHYVRINRWPQMSVYRKQDWSWGMSSVLFSYSSILDAYKEGGTGPLHPVV